jgi:hypothetical protein
MAVTQTRDRQMTSSIITIALPDMDMWDTFAANNREALVEAYGSTDKAFQHAINGGLELFGTVFLHFDGELS